MASSRKCRRAKVSRSCVRLRRARLLRSSSLGVEAASPGRPRVLICACGRPEYSSPGKHPDPRRAPHGVKDATIGPDQIHAWYGSGANLSLAIATEQSGLVVLDIDPAKGGGQRNPPLLFQEW